MLRLNKSLSIDGIHYSWFFASLILIFPFLLIQIRANQFDFYFEKLIFKHYIIIVYICINKYDLFLFAYSLVS